VKRKLNERDVKTKGEEKARKERKRVDALIAHRPTVDGNDSAPSLIFGLMLPQTDVRSLVVNKRVVLSVMSPFSGREGRVKLKIIDAP
jgi:hypothetical protein